MAKRLKNVSMKECQDQECDMGRVKTRSDRKLRLRSINTFITCRLCKGYLIEATTITECLHTFCKSCIVKFLSNHNSCPVCQIIVHQSHPLNYISIDRTLQDIVYKVVPNLLDRERRRQIVYWKSKGQEPPAFDDDHLKPYIKQRGIKGTEKDPVKPAESKPLDPNCDYHRSDEQVNVQLESADPEELEPLDRKFLRLSALATITTLKKYIAQRVLKDLGKFSEIDITMDNQILGKDHSLKFIHITKWKRMPTPMRLSYRPKIQL